MNSIPMEPQIRRCVSCRKLAPKSDFWRIVRVYPSHTVQLDQGMGRSAYLCPSEACLKAAQKKNRLGRSLKATVSPDVYHVLWQRLTSESGRSPEPDPQRQPAPREKTNPSQS